jgi:protein-tyrosine phosphatase
MTSSGYKAGATLDVHEVRSSNGIFTDVHCHCLPGLDDGPADMAEALALCRALVADGIAQVVATPHQLGRFDGRCEAGLVRRTVAELNQVLRADGTALTVLPGADVRLDERIPQLLESDAVLTVADGGRYLLLELPHEVFLDPQVLLKLLQDTGVTAVITHPERHEFLVQNPGYVRRWLEYRPCLQITAGSLLGHFGRESTEAAWAFLRMSFPVLIATDAHDLEGRRPCLRAAHQRVRRQLGRAVADAACIENPRRLVAGEELTTLREGL